MNRKVQLGIGDWVDVHPVKGIMMRYGIFSNLLGIPRYNLDDVLTSQPYRYLSVGSMTDWIETKLWDIPRWLSGELNDTSRIIYGGILLPGSDVFEIMIRPGHESSHSYYVAVPPDQPVLFVKNHEIQFYEEQNGAVPISIDGVLRENPMRASSSQLHEEELYLTQKMKLKSKYPFKVRYTGRPIPMGRDFNIDDATMLINVVADPDSSRDEEYHLYLPPTQRQFRDDNNGMHFRVNPLELGSVLELEYVPVNN